MGKNGTNLPEEDTDLREDLEIDEPEEELEEELEAQETEVEKKARQMGWHPKNEYMGPPHKWVPADEFIRRGENILPILRENYRNLQTDYQRLNDQMREQSDMLKEMRERMKGADDRAYQRAIKDLEKQKEAAVEEGDKETYRRLDMQLKEVEKAREEAVTKPPPPNPQNQTPPEITAFMRENPWYTNDQFLNLQMQAEHVRLKGEEPALSLAENLQKAKEAVMAKYPQKFGRPATPSPRPRAAAVATPSPGGRQPSRRPVSPIDQIEDPNDRAQAREAYNRYKRQMPDFTEQEYMQFWNDPKADVLTVRRSNRENLRGRQ